MHGSGTGSTAGWVQEAEFGEGSGCCVGIEVLHWYSEFVVAALEGPVEEPGIYHAGISVCVVVLPGMAGFRELLEDSALGQAMGVSVEAFIIGAVSS